MPGTHATSPQRACPATSPGWRRVRGSWVLLVWPRCPGAGPSPAPALAPRSARRAAPPAPLAARREGNPAKTARPSVPRPCRGLGAGRPGEGVTPWERGHRASGRRRRPGGGGGIRAEEEEEEAGRRRWRGGRGGELGGRRLPASAARPGPAGMRVTSAPSARPPRDASPAE